MRGLVRLDWNRKGCVVAAHEVHTQLVPAGFTPVRPPLKTSIPKPTRYSFEDRELQTKPWDLRRLNGSRHGIRYAPEDLRHIFLQVVLDCLP